MRPLKEPTREEYAAIFARLHKNTPASQNLNCAACGYQTCRDMAKAIFNQLDRPEDCMDYNRKEVIRENENLRKTRDPQDAGGDHPTQHRQNAPSCRMQRQYSMEEVYRGNERPHKILKRSGMMYEVATYAENCGTVAEINDTLTALPKLPRWCRPPDCTFR